MYLHLKKNQAAIGLSLCLTNLHKKISHEKRKRAHHQL